MVLQKRKDAPLKTQFYLFYSIGNIVDHILKEGNLNILSGLFSLILRL